jgi:hypothetical protein
LSGYFRFHPKVESSYLSNSVCYSAFRDRRCFSLVDRDFLFSRAAEGAQSLFIFSGRSRKKLENFLSHPRSRPLSRWRRLNRFRAPFTSVTPALSRAVRPSVRGGSLVFQPPPSWQVIKARPRKYLSTARSRVSPASRGTVVRAVDSTRRNQLANGWAARLASAM